MVYMHAYLNILLLLHSAFMLCVNKPPLNCTANSHGKYTVDHGQSWKNHGILFLNFCGNPVIRTSDNCNGSHNVWLPTVFSQGCIFAPFDTYNF